MFSSGVSRHNESIKSHTDIKCTLVAGSCICDKLFKKERKKERMSDL